MSPERARLHVQCVGALLHVLFVRAAWLKERPDLMYRFPGDLVYRIRIPRASEKLRRASVVVARALRKCS